MVERDDSVCLGGGHGQAPADIVEGTRGDPAEARLNGVERGQEEVAARSGCVAAQQGSYGPPLPRFEALPPRPKPAVPERNQRRLARPPSDRGHGSEGPLSQVTPSRSTRMAAALNSAVPDLGSVASIVRMLVATSSWK